MSNEITTNPSNEKDVYPQTVLDKVDYVASPAPVADKTLEITCDVGVTSMLKSICQMLLTAIRLNRIPTTLTDSRIEEYLISLIQLRVLQVGDNFPKSYHVRTIPIPDFFRPILKNIGKLEIPLLRARVSLQWMSDDAASEDGDTRKSASQVTLSQSQMEEVAWDLKCASVSFTNGMPRILTVDDDAIFRIYRNEVGELLVAGPEPGQVAFIVRSVVDICSGEKLWGYPRTRYVSVEDLTPAWEMIVRTAVGSNCE